MHIKSNKIHFDIQCTKLNDKDIYVDVLIF